MYDIIGDIHGHASSLKKLLGKLGYERDNGTYRHPGRKILFVGDYIDRGPEIPETLNLVRNMVDAGQAIALMGNHEYNAIMYNEPDGKGGYLRPHTERKVEQHRETLEQFENSDEDYDFYINWFKTLPLYFENEDFRAIHACWNHENLKDLEKYAEDGVIHSDDFWKAEELDDIAEELLKGKEVRLPEGISFSDNAGTEREEVRVRWWLNPAQVTMKEWSINEVGALDGNMPIDAKYYSEFWYDEGLKPVFFGHYWMTGTPQLQRSNVCCLDYSIGKEDKLVAYRHNGEQALSKEQLEWVEYSN